MVRKGLFNDDCSSSYSGSSSSSASATNDSTAQERRELDPMDVETYRLILALPSEMSPISQMTEEVIHQVEEDVEASASILRSESSRKILVTPIRRARTASLLLKAEWDMIAHNIELEYTEAELYLRQDLAAGKLRWYGDWRSDLWCFLRNNNPVLSVCYSHPLHPVSRNQRLFAYFLTTLNALYCSIAITHAQDCIGCGVERCNVDAAATTCLQQEDMPSGRLSDLIAAAYPRLTHNFCCTCWWLGISPTVERFPHLGGPLYAMTSTCIITMLIFQMMMCLCIQHLDPRKREVGSLLGYAIVGIIALFLLYPAPLLLYYAWVRHDLGFMLAVLAVGKIGGWAFVTALNVTAFHIMWRAQTKKEASDRLVDDDSFDDFDDFDNFDNPDGGGAVSKKFHVTAADYNAFLVARRNENEAT